MILSREPELTTMQEMSNYFPIKTMWRSYFCALVATAMLAVSFVIWNCLILSNEVPGYESIQDWTARHVPGQIRSILALLRNHLLYNTRHIWRSLRRFHDEMELTISGFPEEILDEVCHLRGHTSSYVHSHYLLPKHVLTNRHD